MDVYQIISNHIKRKKIVSIGKMEIKRPERDTQHIKSKNIRIG